jgi:hypothetical protein
MSSSLLHIDQMSPNPAQERQDRREEDWAEEKEGA